MRKEEKRKPAFLIDFQRLEKKNHSIIEHSS